MPKAVSDVLLQPPRTEASSCPCLIMYIFIISFIFKMRAINGRPTVAFIVKLFALFNNEYEPALFLKAFFNLKAVLSKA